MQHDDESPGDDHSKNHTAGIRRGTRCKDNDKPQQNEAKQDYVCKLH